MEQDTHHYNITEPHAASRLGCSESTLRKSRTIGELFGFPAPLFKKLGTYKNAPVRYSDQSLCAFMDQLPALTQTEYAEATNAK